MTHLPFQTFPDIWEQHLGSDVADLFDGGDRRYEIVTRAEELTPEEQRDFLEVLRSAGAPPARMMGPEDLTTWTSAGMEVWSPPGLPNRAGAVVATDTMGRTLLFGGFDGDGYEHQDTLIWDGRAGELQP